MEGGKKENFNQETDESIEENIKSVKNSIEEYEKKIANLKKESKEKELWFEEQNVDLKEEILMKMIESETELSNISISNSLELVQLEDQQEEEVSSFLKGITGYKDENKKNIDVQNSSLLTIKEKEKKNLLNKIEENNLIMKEKSKRAEEICKLKHAISELNKEIDDVVSSREHNLQMYQLRINRLNSVFEKSINHKKKKISHVLNILEKKKKLNKAMLDDYRMRSKEEVCISKNRLESIEDRRNKTSSIINKYVDMNKKEELLIKRKIMTLKCNNKAKESYIKNEEKLAKMEETKIEKVRNDVISVNSQISCIKEEMEKLKMEMEVMREEKERLRKFIM